MQLEVEIHLIIIAFQLGQKFELSEPYDQQLEYLLDSAALGFVASFSWYISIISSALPRSLCLRSMINVLFLILNQHFANFALSIENLYDSKKPLRD